MNGPALAAILGSGAIALGAGVAVVVGRNATAQANTSAPPPREPLPHPLRHYVNHRERLQGEAPEILAAMDEWEARGPFAIVIPEHGGARTSEAEQAELKAEGASNAGSLEETPHGHAAAFDAAPYRKGADGLFAPDYSRAPDFDVMAAFFKPLGFEWGGDWSALGGGDRDHFQLPDWRSRPLASAPEVVS